MSPGYRSIDAEAAKANSKLPINSCCLTREFATTRSTPLPDSPDELSFVRAVNISFEFQAVLRNHQKTKQMALRKLTKELKAIEAKPDDRFSLGPIGEDLFKWRGTIMGPVQLAYKIVPLHPHQIPNTLLHSLTHSTPHKRKTPHTKEEYFS